ncbi:hypothetical protein [Cyclobacterium xiamenense]|uniref:hypothetical protein n=1 Tax=Cyclobacterium xiamenense TaxID=1297121 RepID=UPI0015A57D3B|nr:hypothetical protein [Cyclobacterium xiamenense]
MKSAGKYDHGHRIHLIWMEHDQRNQITKNDFSSQDREKRESASSAACAVGDIG